MMKKTIKMKKKNQNMTMERMIIKTKKNNNNGSLRYLIDVTEWLVFDSLGLVSELSEIDSDRCDKDSSCQTALL